MASDAPLPPIYRYHIICEVEFDDGDEVVFEIDFVGYRLPSIGEALWIYGKDRWLLRITDVQHDIQDTLTNESTGGPTVPTFLLKPEEGTMRHSITLLQELNEYPERNGLVGLATWSSDDASELDKTAK